jgi:site-specific DNA-cytosine methylase
MRLAGPSITAADLFCGAGGTSTGLMRAVRALGLQDADVDLLAINHWDVAIQTHSANVKQIGNAVHVDLAEALCREALRPAAKRLRAA